jgi:hypothetical protein
MSRHNDGGKTSPAAIKKMRSHVKIVNDRHGSKYICPQNRTAKMWLSRLLFYSAQVVINLKTLILQLNEWLTA